MKINLTARRRIAAFAAALGLTCGCGPSSPSRVYGDKPDQQAGQRAIELYGGGKPDLDAKALEKAPGLRAAMHQVDLNKDGKLSADEISARIESWSVSKVGRRGISYVVMHNGKPVVDAVVKFVPEKFLGDGMKTYEGTTDNFGTAHLCLAGTSERGVSPGFYRIEITKSGESIPARYNTETQLGQEVASDAAGIEGGRIRIELKY
jgi:hypothetical protein